jgi:aminocarboxymuconate-semialdehyde decarboxylase
MVLYSCNPSTSSRAAGRPRGRSRAARKHLTVDIHCHVFTPQAEALVKPYYRLENDTMARFSSESTREVNLLQMQTIAGKLTSVEARLADMDAMGIDVQAISPAPPQYHYWTEPELGREAARLINQRLAEIVASHPDRFVAMGMVPLQAPELAVEELERMVKQLGFRGVEIAPHVAAMELSDPRLSRFFARAEELGALVFIHPQGFSDGQRLSDHYFINVIGNPLDSTVGVSHLIFGGVLEARPKLKVCVAHGGGYLAAYAGRMDHAWTHRPDCRLHIKRKPTSYLKRLYFDTIVYTPHQLEYLVAQYGADHILLGTDYPYDMGMTDPVGFVAGVKRLGREAREAITGGNAARLLRLARRSSGQ